MFGEQTKRYSFQPQEASWKLYQSCSCGGRGTGSNPVPGWPRLDPDHRDYVGCKQKLCCAVNHRMGIEPDDTPPYGPAAGTRGILALNRTVVLRYRIFLEQKQYAPTTINLRLAAVRRVALEAADSGLLGPELAAGIRRLTLRLWSSYIASAISHRESLPARPCRG